jgi:hypothetical protein
VASFDLAVIPLDKRKGIMWNKPENKLLFFWQLGLPAITSPSPAYKRVMNDAGINMNADSKEEWLKKIREYKNMKDKAALLTGMKNYISSHHTKELLINQWKKIFEF